MGGTDQGDQLASYYRFEHRTTKWPHRIFTHFIMTAAVNAYILYREHNNLPKLSLLDFLDGLMDELIVADGIAVPAPVVGGDLVREDQPKSKRVATCSANTDRICSTHVPCLVKGARRRCMAGCGRRISSKCRECDAFLCMNWEGDDSCWEKYHSAESLV